MARQEAHREDLFAECTALVQRIELSLGDSIPPVVAGRRSTGAWSIYFGPDPCFHFDPQGRLRRAFVDDRLYRTEGDTLAELIRIRTPETTELLSRDLDHTECRRFLSQMHRHIATLREALDQHSIRTLRSLPSEAEVIEGLRNALQTIADARPQLAPPIKKGRGRRK